ncbi:DUF87 domain-containing protein [Glycomyces sp. NPDC046736]|uniref:helicase HerA domain-containing protein n=1 Tax=Glycomyces sp. NPDC046736 TaxID=3155615 RepID=UPI0033C2ACC8
MTIPAKTRRALEALDQLVFTVLFTDVWRDTDVNVAMHNSEALRLLKQSLKEAYESQRRRARGLIFAGPPGSGKTHLTREGRMELEHMSGTFVQLDVQLDEDVTKSAVLSFAHALTTSHRGGHNTQIQNLLARLVALALPTGDESAMLIMDGEPTFEAVGAFVAGASKRFGSLNRDEREVLRVLCLQATGIPEYTDLAEDWFACKPERVEGDRARWGIREEIPQPRRVLFALSNIASLVGPVLMSVDQIDEMVQSADADITGSSSAGDLDRELGELSAKLMDYIENTHRTVLVVSCLEGSWSRLQKASLASVEGRFWSPQPLSSHPSRAAAASIVASHVAEALRDVDFKVPWDTWPVKKEAFQDLNRTPREIIRGIQEHARKCIHRNEFVPLTSFPALDSPEVESSVDSLTADFERLLSVVDVSAAVDPEQEGQELPPLLEAGIGAYAIENSSELTVRPAATKQSKQGIHVTAWEGNRRWCIRGVALDHGPGFKARLNWLIDQSKSLSNPDITAVALQTTEWNLSATNKENLVERQKSGLKVYRADMQDLKICAALVAFKAKHPVAYATWLKANRPMSGTRLIRNIFEEQGGEPPPPGSEAPTSTSILLGRFTNGDPALIELERLRKHVALFAGSGSGKTVVLRRLIEECALQGVSSIVLDPNNDLARLGQPWPRRPGSWSDQDDERASAYFEGTEVVIWTPRVLKGRPVSFQPLPDFGSVVEDVDEFDKALDSAVSSLAPRAKITGDTAKHEEGRAVIRAALRHYAQHGGKGLDGFLQLLSELPADIVNLSKASETAHKLSETLRASQINDPLFGGDGSPLNPGELFRPVKGKRARISVVSFIGLPDPVQRQSFVNQLQMALFAWIKQYPAGDRPLGGLLVMDEAQTFAPSGAMTPCTGSTLALASQARKYGLGLVFATQAPRGVHNQVVGNCSTQMVGFLSHSTQIAAVKEMADARQAGRMELSGLAAGQFYLRSEGAPHQLITTPMCLSNHPKSALTPEEIVELARAGE